MTALLYILIPNHVPAFPKNSKILHSKLKNFQLGIQNFTIFAVQKRKKKFFICT